MATQRQMRRLKCLINREERQQLKIPESKCNSQCSRTSWDNKCSRNIPLRVPTNSRWWPNSRCKCTCTSSNNVKWCICKPCKEKARSDNHRHSQTLSSRIQMLLLSSRWWHTSRCSSSRCSSSRWWLCSSSKCTLSSKRSKCRDEI